MKWRNIDVAAARDKPQAEFDALRYARSDDMVRELTVRIMQHPDKSLRVAYLHALDTLAEAFGI